jgi:hypothetical protein
MLLGPRDRLPPRHTLLVVATYVIAPLPNWLCGRAANRDDFMESTGNGVVDFGRFLTGFFVVMGIGECFLHRHARLRCLYWHIRKRGISIKGVVLTDSSPPNTAMALGGNRRRRSGHVHLRRSADIRDHHQLHAVLPGARRLLTRWRE